MKLTAGQLKAMLPNIKNAELWTDNLNIMFEKYGINTEERIAGFLAQAGHETLDFNRLTENLNYTWQRLRIVFPRYFPNDNMAKAYHRLPEKIANRVYDDALRSSKLGNTQAGDGWRFRGRGIFQLTGRENYTAFAKAVGMTPEAATAYVESVTGACESACWFWSTRNLNRFADKRDIVGMSRAVNGGDHGMTDRINRWNKNLALLAGPFPLKVGSRGDEVKRVQAALKIDADGKFGKNTDKAVRAYQSKNNLEVTGIITKPLYELAFK